MRQIFFGPLSELFDGNHGRVINLQNKNNKSTDLYYVKDNDKKIAAGIDIALPGVPKSNVSINIEGNKILISVDELPLRSDREYIEGHTDIDKSEYNESYEINPEVFNLSKITCNMENGILTILVPFNEKPKARSIKIG